MIILKDKQNSKIHKSMTEAGVYHACDVEYEEERFENSGKYFCMLNKGIPLAITCNSIWPWSQCLTLHTPCDLLH